VGGLGLLFGVHFDRELLPGFRQPIADAGNDGFSGSSDASDLAAQCNPFPMNIRFDQYPIGRLFGRATFGNHGFMHFPIFAQQVVDRAVPYFLEFLVRFVLAFGERSQDSFVFRQEHCRRLQEAGFETALAKLGHEFPTR